MSVPLSVFMSIVLSEPSFPDPFEGREVLMGRKLKPTDLVRCAHGLRWVVIAKQVEEGEGWVDCVRWARPSGEGASGDDAEVVHEGFWEAEVTPLVRSALGDWSLWGLDDTVWYVRGSAETGFEVRDGVVTGVVPRTADATRFLYLLDGESSGLAYWQPNLYDTEEEAAAAAASRAPKASDVLDLPTRLANVMVGQVTYEMVADAAGLSASYISQIVRKVSPPSSFATRVLTEWLDEYEGAVGGTPEEEPGEDYHPLDPWTAEDLYMVRYWGGTRTPALMLCPLAGEGRVLVYVFGLAGERVGNASFAVVESHSITITRGELLRRAHAIGVQFLPLDPEGADCSTAAKELAEQVREDSLAGIVTDVRTPWPKPSRT